MSKIMSLDELREYLLARVLKDTATGCWYWQLSHDRWGYGKTPSYTGFWSAHRAAYAAFVGGLPDDLDVAHTCGIKDCINPDHLRLSDKRQTQARSLLSQGHLDRKQCKNGHPYTPENTAFLPSGVRACRACWRDNSIRYKQRNADMKRLAMKHLEGDEVIP
jgi:hypothetical protein